VRKHWLLAVFLTLGLVLRVLATVAYTPAIVYTDSVQYLTNMGKLSPDQLNPIGYDFVTRTQLIIRPPASYGYVGTS